MKTVSNFEINKLCQEKNVLLVVCKLAVSQVLWVSSSTLCTDGQVKIYHQVYKFDILVTA